MANKYGDIELCLDCRQCIEGRLPPKIVVGITADLRIRVWCETHGPVVAFATDGSDQVVLANIIKQGCESCRSGRPHTH